MALDSAFVARFQGFVDAGRYEVRQRQATAQREFYRFVKPEESDYPFMHELFSRAPSGLDLWPGQQIVPVQTEAAVASLSAILMDTDYYELLMGARYDAQGIPMARADALIPLKARAWLDLRQRKGLGMRPADSGANVLLVEPNDEGVFEGAALRDGVWYAAPSQVAVDLLTSPGRGPAEGEELISWMQANEDRWRP